MYYRKSYYLKHPYKFFRELWCRIKWFFQRKTRGWANPDVWDADYAIARYSLPLIKQLRKSKYGWYSLPQSKYGYPYDFSSVDEWHKVLDEIIWAFEFLVKDFEGQYFLSIDLPAQNGHFTRAQLAEINKMEERAQNGFELFGKYFTGLWD